MARLAEADQAALSRLVVAVHPDVYRRCHRLTRHEHTADDLAQEVWRKFVEHWEVLSRRDLDGQLAWLYTVCSNTFVDQVRRQRVWADLIPKVEVLFDHLLAVPDPEEQVLRKDVLDRARRLMREMPPAQYLATWLCWGEGWTTREVADAMGITEGTVRSHRSRAAAWLQSRIDQDLHLVDDVAEDERRGA